MRMLLLAAVAVVGLSGSAIATDGNDLFTECDGLQGSTTNPNDLSRWAFCSGFILGVFETNYGRYALAERNHKIGCPDDDERCRWDIDFLCVDVPHDYSNRQIVDIVHLYLANNPAFRHENASFLVTEALKDAWPCQ